MRKKSLARVLFFLTALLVFDARFVVGAGGLQADIVIYNARILTLDSPDPDNFSTAQAAAIYGGKFVAVGSNEAVLEYAGAKTTKIDLGGRTVLPGLVESHQHTYGGAGHWFPRGKPKVGSTDPSVRFTNKAEFLAQIRTLALNKKPGEWIITGVSGGLSGMVPELQLGEVTRLELDKVAPNNPIHFHWNVTVEGLVNSKALEPLLARYPKIQGVIRDPKGVPTGRVTGLANLILLYEFWPQIPPEELAPYYKLELEEAAATGLTVITTRLQPNHLAAYGWLNARGELPLRFAYSLETAARSENPEAIISRLTGLQGGMGQNFWTPGDDKLWMIGLTAISADSVSSVGGSCVSKPFPREALNFPAWKYQFYGPNGVCRLKDPNYRDADVFRAAAKYGLRMASEHVAGDRALDQYLDLMEELSREYPHITQQRWGIDHCQVVREDQVQRAKKLQPVFSCAPLFLYNGEKGHVGAYSLIFGEKEGADQMVPFRRFLHHGVRVVMELDNHDMYPFLALQVAVTRKDIDGKEWAPEQRISRREALYTYTRWSAEYVLRENLLGSIEPGKAADFIVLNKDYLTVPENEIGRIDPLLTVMDGKITYTQPEFATSMGLPQVGFRGKPTWMRGTPDDRRRGGAGDGAE